MNFRVLFLISNVVLFAQPISVDAHDEWKIAVGAGAIVAGGALLWHGISEYNTRASLADDKSSVDKVGEYVHTLSRRYHFLLEKRADSQESFARRILSSGEHFEDFEQKLEEDIRLFDEMTARLETNYEYWEDIDNRLVLRHRAQKILPKARTLRHHIHEIASSVMANRHYIVLFEKVEKTVNYFNPTDPFKNIHAVAAMERDCRALYHAISCLERGHELSMEDHTLLARARVLVDGLERQKESLETSAFYARELQLKLQDERTQERLVIERRKAHAEEEKARALAERNRLDEQARWNEERELSSVRERLSRIEHRIKELKQKTENPPYKPESDEFYLWIRGELRDCDC